MNIAKNPDNSPFQRYAAWANVVMGFLVFVSRYASPRPSFGVHRNLFFTGLLLMFAALASVIASDGNASRNYWPAVNVAAGAWLVASVAFIPSIASVALMQQLFGAVIAVVALASIFVGPVSIRLNGRHRLVRPPR